MNPSLEHLVTTLLWSETDNADENGGKPLDWNYRIDDVDAASLLELDKRFQAFVGKAEEMLTAKLGDDWSSIDDFYTGSSNSEYQTEHDYIMTVNGHGCGFWEKYDWQETAGEILTELATKQSEIHAFVGDDGKVYLEFG